MAKIKKNFQNFLKNKEPDNSGNDYSDIKNQESEIHKPSQEVSSNEKSAINDEVIENSLEKRGLLSKEELDIQKKIREKIEEIHLDSDAKQQAGNQAQSIKYLQEEGKIKSLLKIVKEKGVVYAVNVAKKMDDPYILDELHDILAKEGYYKKFIK